MAEITKYLSQADIEVGAKVPNFRLLDMNDNSFTLKDILGKPAVLYFYPLDNSSLCTEEACEFRDVYDELQELDCAVYGISPDDHESHMQFSEKHELPFQLCCDPSEQMMKDYGIWAEFLLNQKEIERFRENFPKFYAQVYDEN